MNTAHFEVSGHAVYLDQTTQEKNAREKKRTKHSPGPKIIVHTCVCWVCEHC